MRKSISLILSRKSMGAGIKRSFAKIESVGFPTNSEWHVSMFYIFCQVLVCIKCKILSSLRVSGASAAIAEHRIAALSVASRKLAMTIEVP